MESGTSRSGYISPSHYWKNRRFESLFRGKVKDLCDSNGIDLGGFDVLLTLRRQGRPYRLTPTQLYRDLVLTSGAMTRRLDGLEREGLIERCKDPNDRRGMLAALTEKGKRIAEVMLADHMRNEAQAISCLNKDERATLALLMKKVLSALEEEIGA